MLANTPLLVFGYGSLIWRPDFPHASAHPARLNGWHRSFCIWSHHHRGTAARPGLVLGLRPGGACRGMAFRVAAQDAAAALAVLDARELVAGEYRRTTRPVMLLDSGERLTAVLYVADRAAPVFVPGLPADRAAAAIATAHGISGANRDYLTNTLAGLRAMGVRDRGLERVAALLPGLAAARV
ncbi:gamma-glutamylcyclotransferase [Humitalea sp. 24SJ18S-53]|uniref:gamma-glutamylcyclotransferase n=1 Tax=Humitalea sp. 24SJ18S-53 TaxID=3422307 RepID=UPI003D6669FF